jgi:hypothetical protein
MAGVGESEDADEILIVDVEQGGHMPNPIERLNGEIKRRTGVIGIWLIRSW